jgi:DNA polymerase-3 subunit alpha
MKRAKELGMTHLAQTNHGTLAGHRPFQEAAKAAGITPILGIESYLSSTDRFDKRSKKARGDDDDSEIYNHLILLAQNEAGLKNLNYITEKSWTEGFYSKNRIDTELLFGNSEGLICLSGCLSGLIPKAIMRGDMEDAYKIAYQWKEALGDRFYIEVQGHNPVALNLALLELADKVGLKAVATSDCHHARKEDIWVEDAMLIVSSKPKRAPGTTYEKSKQYKTMMERFNYLWPERRMTFQKFELFLRDRKTNQELFHEQNIVRTDIYDNTMEIASRIEEVPYYEGLDFLPKPEGDPNEILREKAYEGLEHRGALGELPEYVARLEEELEIIKNKDFSNYFLMVEDFVTFAKNNDIPVGPGRGSAAGSLVCYALGITDADPIEHGLLFFRFIDPGRDDFPDIDTDFGDIRRPEVKQYLADKYGYVASIATFNKFQGKNALKDAAKVLGVPVADVNRATKNNDAPPGAYYFDTFDESEQGKEFTKQYPEAVDLAKRLYGRIRQIGMHAAGVVVANQPISNYAPVQTASDPNDKTAPRVPYIGNDMEQVAEIGFIKFDILGLKNLTVIDETLKLIRLRKGIDIDLQAEGYADENVYKMLAAGHTKAVFQAEGGTFTNWIKQTKCEDFNDLVVGTSIARPGPLQTVGEIYKKRLNQDYWVEDHAEREIVGETKGLVVYQEQVMRYMTEIGGMTMSEANKVRKIIGKKRDVTEFEQYKSKFVDGAAKRLGRARAAKLWKDFEAHAGYSFNKSHAVVYSMITYWTAFLKHYYPLEYMASVLKNEKDKDSFTDYLIETKRLGLTIYLPHINQSEVDVSIQEGGIRLGLSNVKYVSAKTAETIISHRPYKNFAHLSELGRKKGSGMNTRMIGALDKVGAAQFPDNPLKGNEQDFFYEYMKVPLFKIRNIPLQAEDKFRALEDFEETGVFPILAMARGIKRGPGWARVDFVDETGDAGIFTIQDTPIQTGQQYAMLIADNRIAKYMTVEELSLGLENTFYKWLVEERHSVPEDALRVISFKPHTTKAGKRMAYVVVQDDTGHLFHVLAFTSMYMQAVSKCKEGTLIHAKVAETEDGTLFFEEISKYA